MLAVDTALKGALTRYSGLLPPTLIRIGKTALGAPGKVLHWQALASEGGSPPIPNWPLITLAGYRASLQPDERGTWRRALPAAVSVEIMVAATDLIDEWSDGDPSAVIDEFGAGQALNAASLMLVMSQQVLLWTARESDERALLAMGTLQDLLVEAAVGQHLDMLYEGMGVRDVTPDMSGEMGEMKAGALLSGALKMGGLMAGAPPDVLALLERFGKRVGGMAQTANDLRDVLPGGDSSLSTGAGPKTDIRRRKRTLPIVYALRDEGDKPNPLQQAFSAPPLDDEDEEALRRAVQDAGGIDFAYAALEWYRQDAAEALVELDTLRPGAGDELGFLQ